MPDELSDLLEELDKMENMAKEHDGNEGGCSTEAGKLAEALPIREDAPEEVPEAEPIEHPASSIVKDPLINGIMDDLKAIIASMGECRSILNGSAKSG